MRQLNQPNENCEFEETQPGKQMTFFRSANSEKCESSV